jgi:periplasmic divalent cation tolerance protein
LLQVTTTTASREEAELIGRTLVEEKLAACAQVSGPVSSFFHWEGQLDSATEWFCFLKTSVDRYPALEQRLASLHPYETPEVIAVPIEHSRPEYTAWVMESLQRDS